MDDCTLCEAGVWELRFELLQVEILKQALQEIKVIGKDNLSNKVAEIALERHELDKLIHARVIFNTDKWVSSATWRKVKTTKKK